MNTLDIIVLGIVGLSGLFAFARGFVREALSIGACVGAAFVAIYSFPLAQPFARKTIGSPALADIVAGAVLFLVPLVALNILTAGIAARVKGSSLSALDRTLGFVFGLVRGAVIACLAYLLLSWALPEKDWPDWAQNARTRKLLASGADSLRSLVPGKAGERGAAAAAEAQRALEDRMRDEIADRAMRALASPAAPKAPQAAAQPPVQGYKPAERREMDRLFQNAQ
jgi:membrane protein required for colicin V production